MYVRGSLTELFSGYLYRKRPFDGNHCPLPLFGAPVDHAQNVFVGVVIVDGGDDDLGTIVIKGDKFLGNFQRSISA